MKKIAITALSVISPGLWHIKASKNVEQIIGTGGYMGSPIMIYSKNIHLVAAIMQLVAPSCKDAKEWGKYPIF